MNDETTALTEILNQYEARANAATPGPWISQETPFADKTLPSLHTVWRPETESRLAVMVARTCFAPTSDPNGAFIAASRTDVPALVKALRRAVEMLKWAVEGDAALLAHRERELADLLREPEKKQDLGE